MDLGSAKDFLQWHPEVQAFKVHPGAALEQYVGPHKVCMNVTFYNSTYFETYADCFTLTIEAPNQPTWTPPVANTSEPVPQFTVVTDYGLELGPFNPHQPIPYILDLSVSGLLTIGWDRNMTARDDFEKINPARVGIKNLNVIEAAQN